MEIISGGTIATHRLSYFAEWRLLSQELRADGTIRDCSGRFEDIFIIAEVDKSLSATVGQFRLLSQVDVSRRLSISEPLPFSSSLGGKAAASKRLTSLRSLSPSGRSPALRFQYHYDVYGSQRKADGWFVIVNLPFSGEFSIPLTTEAHREASFEFEALPKGLFLETFLRSGLTSIGAHVFAGNNDRLLGQLILATNYQNLYITAVLGTGKESKISTTNVMFEAEYIPMWFSALGVRFEDQMGIRRKPAAIAYGVVHFPGSSYTVRFSLEWKIQEGNNHTSLETSLIF